MEMPGLSLLNKIGARRRRVWAIGHVISPLQPRVLVVTGGRVSLTQRAGKPVLRPAPT
jgi:hypothetical protein